MTDTSSAYRVLARKYRPTRLGDLLGQDALVRTLTNAIESGRIAHAFVLTGVRDAALVSLRRKHLDPVQGRLNQDAGEVDTKFGKNLWTHFFPVPPPIRDVVTGWVEELDALGYPDAELTRLWQLAQQK